MSLIRIASSALMLFDTGPGYRSDDGRAGWNRIALSRAKELETKGLAALSVERRSSAEPASIRAGSRARRARHAGAD